MVYLTQTPRYLPPGRPCWHPRKSCSCAGLTSNRNGTGCPARNEGTARPAGNPDHLDAGSHEHEHAQPAVLSALVRDERKARPFVNAVQHYRDNPDNDLGKTGIRICSPHDVPALPNGCLDVRSRWYRLNLTVQQGARENTLTSVGWVTHEYVTWEYRAVH